MCGFLYNFVYAFHVPVFFFCSGLGYALGRKRTLGQNRGRLLARKAKATLLPVLARCIRALHLTRLCGWLGLPF